MDLEFDPSNIAKNVSVATEYFKAYYSAQYANIIENNKITEQKFSGGTNGFIPFNIEFTVDGIAGMKIYNQLTINTSFLSNGYTRTTDFIITGIDHKLNNNDWVTNIKTTLIPKFQDSDKVITAQNFTSIVFKKEPPKIIPIESDNLLSNLAGTPFDTRDIWVFICIIAREAGNPKAEIDVGQSILNRIGSKKYGKKDKSDGTIFEFVTQPKQYQPAFRNSSGSCSTEWLNIRDLRTARIALNYSYDKANQIKYPGKDDDWLNSVLKSTWLQLKDTKLIQSAQAFIEGRTDFKSMIMFDENGKSLSEVISTADSKAIEKDKPDFPNPNNVWRNSTKDNVFGWMYYYYQNITFPWLDFSSIDQLKGEMDNIVIPSDFSH